ncbi:hypothetical protein BFL38_02505 [Brachyspira hampsonii]|uniref:Uncharacterized protein n=1 Tax=Brachyspira hampsonii TaxID=1287055 RepID=A0A1E5NBU3_9SPIR|nr:hypothetical protein BFL38_02505 [Brachyspira hampsonii]
MPFLFSLVSADSYNIDDYKEFERLDFGVLLENIKVKLPEPLNKRGVAYLYLSINIFLAKQFLFIINRFQI